MIAVGPFGGPLKIRKSIDIQSDGSFAITNLDNSVMSVNADGTEKTATSVSFFEKCTRPADGILCFWVGPNPDWHGFYANVFQIVEYLPND